jgi:tetratricopeptide (TPR) repeat protein
MRKGHLTEWTVRRLLAPDYEEEPEPAVVRHLAICPCCFAVALHIVEMTRYGGVSLWFPTLEEELAASRREAVALWEELRRWPRRSRLDLVRHARRFRSWGLCELLCAESLGAAAVDAAAGDAAAGDAAAAVECGELAVALAGALREWEPADWHCLHALRAFAWAHLGNAWRAAGELRAADEAFGEADRWWESGAGAAGSELGYLGRMARFRASLRRAQGRFDEALSLLDTAVAACEASKVGNLLISRACCLEALGNLEGALATVEAAARTGLAEG